MKELLDYREASEILGLPVGTLYAKVSRKEIPHVRFGIRSVRFYRDDLLALISRGTVQAVDDQISQKKTDERKVGCHE